MPKICYVSKSFTPSHRNIIDTANTIIESYQAMGLTLTLRQLYYRFIAADAFPNTENSYKRLGGIINDARLAGRIDWNAIEDRGREVQIPSHWDSPSDIIDAAAGSYRIDKWEDQPARVEVWVEKQALEEVIGRAARELDCAYFACKGYTSQSAMWRAAMRFKRYNEMGQRVVVIHLGDHDPSGIDMTRDIDDRITKTFEQFDVKVDRIALNMDQVRHYRPPPNPAKLTDSRARSYVSLYGNESWELDALEPDVLHRLIQRSILAHRVEKLYAAKQAEEDRQRELLRAVSNNWSDIEEQY